MLFFDNARTRFGENMNALLELFDSEFAFHLTGSRFFGFEHTLSDYDFFTKDTPQVRKWLEQHGFKHVDAFGFRNMESVYPNDVNIGEVFTKGKIQIQVVRDDALKTHAQELIASLPEFVLKRVSGEQKNHTYARDVWHWAYSRVGKDLGY